jgi:hypothetical protein
MKYAVEMTLGSMVVIPSLMKTGTDLKVVRGGGYTYRHTQEGDLISPLLFKIRKVG